MSERARCPECDQSVSCGVPRGGDGSLSLFHTHTYRGMAIRCPMSRRDITSDPGVANERPKGARGGRRPPKLDYDTRRANAQRVLEELKKRKCSKKNPADKELLDAIGFAHTVCHMLSASGDTAAQWYDAIGRGDVKLISWLVEQWEGTKR